MVVLLYPMGNKILSLVRGQSSSSASRNNPSIYPYSLPNNLVIKDPSGLLPAEAVPILMYHGIIAKGAIVTNTDRETFISQMEMLKQKGYQTISIKEYDFFREGKFTLPAKPIIITFDDGRKDSFYTVDKILEQLGFKATIFLATIKANTNDPFYLNWDELSKMQATGRWEIEAHGRRSHEEVPIDDKGTLGRYYTSLIYTPGKGLESIEDYKKRVEQDYIDGIADIKNHLGLEASYFAVPLSSYGINDDSNYPDAFEFNKELTKHFFKLAFIEIPQKDGLAGESFYNYQNSNPAISLKRLEVKNISADNLLKSLDRFSPKKPNFVFPDASNSEAFSQNIQLLYGEINTNKGITLLSSTSTPSARMLLGDKGWKNYAIGTRVSREKGRSMSIIVYYTDDDNFIILDWGENSLSLIERIDGKEQRLASYYPWDKKGEVEILIRVHDGYISAYFSGILLAKNVPIKLSRGAPGFSVWDPSGAKSTIRRMEIKSLDK